MPYSGTQFRPQGSDGPFYNPDRDLAYNFAAAFSQAVRALDERYISDELKAFCDRIGVTEGDVQRVVDTIDRVLDVFVLRRETDDPREALERCGWYQLPFESRYVVMSRLGEVMLAAFLYSMVQVHTVHGTTPPECHLEDMMAACRRVVGLPDTPDNDDEDQSHRLSAQVDVLRADLAHMQNVYDQLNNRLIAMEKACHNSKWWWIRFALSSPKDRKALLGM